MPRTAPSPIKGSIGSRIRVIFGDSGSEWLLLLNEQDGDIEWQTHDWKGIPGAVANQLNNLPPKGRHAQFVDFGPSDSTPSWFINGVKRDGTGSHCWWGGTQAPLRELVNTDDKVYPSFGTDSYGTKNFAIVVGRNGYSLSSNVPDGLEEKIMKINKANGKINLVRLFANNGYFIKDKNGTEWCGVGHHCSKELKKSTCVEDVAVATDGSWLIIEDETFTSSSGVDSNLCSKIASFYSEQRRRNLARSKEIRKYHDDLAQREQEERERRAREEVERRRLEEEERLRREQEERLRREQEERLRLEQEEKERREREEREEEQAKIELAERASRADALENMLEEHIMEERGAIHEMERVIEKRKRQMQNTLMELPPARRARLEEQVGIVYDTSDGKESSWCSRSPMRKGPLLKKPDKQQQSRSCCVVCCDSEISRVVVPCGHFCLCDKCTDVMLRMPERSCPVCRGRIENTITVFMPGE